MNECIEAEIFRRSTCDGNAKLVKELGTVRMTAAKKMLGC